MGYNIEIDSSKRKIGKAINFADKSNIDDLKKQIADIDLKVKDLQIEYSNNLNNQNNNNPYNQ